MNENRPIDGKLESKRDFSTNLKGIITYRKMNGRVGIRTLVEDLNNECDNPCGLFSQKPPQGTLVTAPLSGI